MQRDYTRIHLATQSSELSSLDSLSTEGVNARTADLDRLEIEQALELLNDEDAQVPAAVRAEIPAIAKAVRLAEASIRAGGRLIYVGAGTSGRLGCLDAAEIPPTFGMDPGIVIAVIAGGERALLHAAEGAEDSPEDGATAMAERGVSSRDTVCGIAASGRTPFVVGALAQARRRGARTVSLSNHRPSELEPHADVVIAPLVGPEAISGSTRLKCGTSQKLVLNMISTLTMVRLGKTYGNLMVDLRPTNEKLRHRARRLIAEVTGCSSEEADRLMEASGGKAKTAMLMEIAGVDVSQADALLGAAGGRLREALELARGGAAVSQLGAALLAGALVGAAIAATLLVPWLSRLRAALDRERSRRGSMASTYGRITEQWFPLTDGFPYDSQGFRFIGSPIDGIQFAEDRIIFCEFKANRGELSESQRRIRDLVRQGRVEWQEFRFTDGGRLPDDDEHLTSRRLRRRTRRWE